MNEALVVTVRGFIGFFTLLIFTRILGKQQISQLTFFDYILGITIGSIASSLTTDLSSRAWPHWVGLFTWAFLVFLFQLITLKWRRASKYIDGEPAIVIMNGKILENTLKKIRYRVSDLLEQLRVQGVFDLAQVEFAILETDGKLSVQKKSQYSAVTPQDLNLSTKYQGISTELIYDGVVVEQNLEQVHLNRSWLESQLQKLGVKDLGEVFFASLDTQGNLFVDLYTDSIKSPTDISDFRGPS